MTDPSRLLRFSRSEWPVFVPRVADVADELRTAIADREWVLARQVSVRLGAVADDVVGMARSVGELGERPAVDSFAAFDALSSDPLLGLGLPADRWAEVVNGYAFMRLAIGWSSPLDLVASALCGGDLEWPALHAELTERGAHPAMRDVENLFGTNAWRQVETNPWPPDTDPIATAISNLSLDARSTLATLGGLRRRSIVELRMAAHTMKLSEDRLMAAFRELQDADLAEFPASFETLANELTGAELKAIAVDVGAKRTGKKEELVRRLMGEGHVEPLADAINRRGLYHPVALGPVSDSLGAHRAVAGLWTALWEETSEYAYGDDDYDIDAESAAVDAVSTSEDGQSTEGPKGARWSHSPPGGVADHATVDRHLLVFTRQGSLHAIDETGDELWTVDTGEAKADYSPAVIDSGSGFLLVTTAGVRLFDPTSGSVSWTWTAPTTPVVQQPAIHNERMYVVTDAGLYAVTIAGDTLWHFSRKRLGSPAVGSETVVVTRAGEMLNILDAADGDLVYRGSMDGLPRTWAPLVSQDLVLLSGYHNGRWLSVALDARSGERVWSHDGEHLGDRLTSEPPMVVVNAVHAAEEARLPYGAAEIRRNLMQLLDPDRATRQDDDDLHLGVTAGPGHYRQLARLGDVHVVSDHRTLWGVGLTVPTLIAPGEPSAPRAAVGQRWVAQMEGHGPSSTASLSPIGLADSYVAVAAGLRVFALDRASGALQWESDIVSTSVYCAGPVCLAVYAEHLHALDAADGVVFWERRLHAEIEQVAHDEHSIYIVTEDGGATCLEAASGEVRWSHTGTYRNPMIVYDDDDSIDLDPVEATDLGWACRLAEGRLQWRSPDSVTRAVDAVTGADVPARADAHLLSNGWTDEWLDRDQSEWWHRRSFQDGAIGLLTTGAAWDPNHRGALAIRDGDVEVVHPLTPGWQYDDAVLATDSTTVVLLAEKQREPLDQTDENDVDEDEGVDDGQQWLLSIRLDEEAGIVVEHGKLRGSDVSYDELAVENVPRDVGSHEARNEAYDGVPITDPTLTVWLFEATE